MEFNFHGFPIKYINSNDLEVGRFKYIGCDRDTEGNVWDILQDSLTNQYYCTQLPNCDGRCSE